MDDIRCQIDSSDDDSVAEEFDSVAKDHDLVLVHLLFTTIELVSVDTVLI
jgi:hypothetical protein